MRLALRFAPGQLQRYALPLSKFVPDEFVEPGGSNLLPKQKSEWPHEGAIRFFG